MNIYIYNLIYDNLFIVLIMTMYWLCLCIDCIMNVLWLYYIKVVKALWGQGLLPRVISGASAGSIVTALVGYVW